MAHGYLIHREYGSIRRNGNTRWEGILLCTASAVRQYFGLASMYDRLAHSLLLYEGWTSRINSYLTTGYIPVIISHNLQGVV